MRQERRSTIADRRTASRADGADRPLVRVVLFSGGRGSGALSKQLIADRHIQLTLAINGYDDGASTGEVRRFLGDALGPSDFRKNASRLAIELGTCAPKVVELLDARLPDGLPRDEVIASLRERTAAVPAVAERLEAFVRELETSGRPFNFNDCSVGNLVFAGCFLMCQRRFNEAVDDYCALVGLAPGLIENVTDGSDAHLVAIATDGTVLGSEGEIVGAAGQNSIREIYLIDRPLSADDRDHLASDDGKNAAALFARRRANVALNPRLATKLAEADLIIYAPGTQHSSLFPSYLTPDLSRTISRNLHAIKLLITNIQTDAEIVGTSAVEIIARALYYLNEKGERALPTPCLITHYLVNDPGRVESSAPYVPLGHIEALEDPRLVRIANFEEGVSGRHDAGKILAPFIRSLVEEPRRPRVAIVLHDAGSLNKVTQTLLEVARGKLSEIAVEPMAFYEGDALDESFLASLPFPVRCLKAGQTFEQAIRDGSYDYVVLFDSSGMYRGEDIVALASHLARGRLDAVWGSRRLSLKDIDQSIRFRYQASPVFGALSRIGSHVLSLACLLLYGRYISDTLSAVRAVRADAALDINVPLTHKRASQYLLARLLRDRADILEIPVHFFPISPDRVKRTNLSEGLQSLTALLGGRLMASKVRAAEPSLTSPAGEERRTTPVAPR